MSPFEALFRAAQPGDDPARPHIEAQRMELRDRFAMMQVAHEFKPGDVLRQKRGLGSMDPCVVIALIYFGPIDTGNPVEMVVLRYLVELGCVANTPDCWVGLLSDDGSCVKTLPMTSSMLEPDPDALP